MNSDHQQMLDHLATQLAAMRPTLIIAIGGSGIQCATRLKARLTAIHGDAWQEKVRILAFDTSDEVADTLHDGQIVALEDDAEFIYIGDVPIGNIARNIDNQPAIADRLGSIIDRFPPGAMRSGAKQNRGLGLLAALWRFPIIAEALTRAIWSLARRDHEDDNTIQQRGVNVFIINSLCGGTGAGIFLDMAALIQSMFDALGNQGEFCHITGIGFLPQAFVGVKGPNLLANAGASLRELNHLMTRGGFAAHYPNGYDVTLTTTPFALYYALDGIDERGRTWANVYDLAQMAADAIYLQMATQLGRKGENAFDNVDEILIGRNDDGEATFLSSIGIASMTFDAPGVLDYCARRLLLTLVRDTWLAQPAKDSAIPIATEQLQSLTGARLDTALLYDATADIAMRIDLLLPDWLLDMKPLDMVDAAGRYLREYEQARLIDNYVPLLRRNAQRSSQTVTELWDRWLDSQLLRPGSGCHEVAESLVAMRQTLGEWLAGARTHAQDAHAQAERLVVDRRQAEVALQNAASGLIFGRKERTREASAHLFQLAQRQFEQLFQAHLWQARLHVWESASLHLDTLIERVGKVQQRLIVVAERLAREVPQQAQALAAGGVSMFSLADTAYVDALYTQYAPVEFDIQQALAESGHTALTLPQISAAACLELLVQLLSAPFVPVLNMSIEAVIRKRKHEMGYRARREQLFRLATPSWNLDQARLPNGGAGLVRLEVLGVPDTATTVFDDEPMLVSTRDPYRISALAVVAGAPPSALQQFRRYVREMERVRLQRPLFVLPHFMADGEQARLAFALGSLFDIIYSQGTFFYYRPADPLQKPLLLANGLANALRAMAGREELVTDIQERVQSEVARLGSQQAITLLEAYTNHAPSGNSAIDDLNRQLKLLVRDYADELRRAHELSAGFRQRVNGQ